MTNEERKIIITIAIIGLIIIGVFAIVKHNKNKAIQNNTNVVSTSQNTEQYVQNTPDGSKVNVSDTLHKTITLDGLEISNIQLKEVGGITTLLADVENKSGSATSDKMIKVEVLDK